MCVRGDVFRRAPGRSTEVHDPNGLRFAENEDYDKESVYSLLYAMYANAGTGVPNGCARQPVFAPALG